MKNLPVIAIIGRPNVGKSTLFNRLIKIRKAIVNDMPGVTRDRIFHEVELATGVPVLFTDTGGLEPSTSDYILSQMRTQTLTALAESDLIVMMVDADQGLTAMDIEVADVVRKAARPVILAANKVDIKGAAHNISDFYQLGFQEMLPISSAHGDGMGSLKEKIMTMLHLEPVEESEENDTEEIETELPTEYAISIIGKPNVGKSSLLNRLLGENRALVSDIPGTTRDAVDAKLRYHGRTFRIIDTAGIRRKSKVSNFVEKISVLHAQQNIEKSDFVLMLIDSSQDTSLQDANISGYAHNLHKNVIILFNKWDLVEKDTGTVKKFEEQMRQRMKFLKYAPILFISAKTGQRATRILPLIDQITEQATRKIPTSRLNQFLINITQKHRPPTQGSRFLKFFYITQTGIMPLTFTIFTNSRKQPHFSYQRYIENSLRSEFKLTDVPIKLIFKNRRPTTETKSPGRNRKK
ncbi:MAG: ribosome biogenesis GTPase Der [Acidobacteria bacterium]|nr:MAG: ribosome biogenesis GTPase Der [Acidobacteriota bacterium]RLE24413.1 MAG: ribosome biogenesis GTPase Der [Acidobacteriota bacterium]